MEEDLIFQTLEHGHKDIVLAVNYNLYGNRLATASADHHLRIWDKKNDVWTLTDSWRAHDAEILDVKWNTPLLGATIASISTDTTCKIWTEDPTAALSSGHRFPLSATIPSKSILPHAALAFRAATAPQADTHLALVTMEGNLSILEPRDPSRLNATDWTDWMANSDFMVRTPAPARGDDAAFSLAWHDETLPCWTALAAGLDRRSMGLAVGAMDAVKVYRTTAERRLWLVAEVRLPTLMRSIAWANGAVRGWDLLAAACKDGVVRMLELRTDAAGESAATTARGSGSSVRPTVEQAEGGLVRAGAPRHGPSGIGVGLAGLARTQTGAVVPIDEPVQEPGRPRQHLSPAAEMYGHKGCVWKVGFSFAGDTLTSTGDDGSIRFWKPDIDGEWCERCEIDVKTLRQNGDDEPIEDE